MTASAPHGVGFALFLVCACGTGSSRNGSDGTDGGRREATDVSPADIVGRWDVLIRFEWDDDADRTKFEFQQRDAAFQVRTCTRDDSCAAEAWLCESIAESNAGGISDRTFHISWSFSDEELDSVAELELISLGGGTLRGTLTASPCLDGTPQCVAVVLACSASMGLEPACEGNDYSGLGNCECVPRTTCP